MLNDEFSERIQNQLQVHENNSISGNVNNDNDRNSLKIHTNYSIYSLTNSNLIEQKNYEKTENENLFSPDMIHIKSNNSNRLDKTDGLNLKNLNYSSNQNLNLNLNTNTNKNKIHIKINRDCIEHESFKAIDINFNENYSQNITDINVHDYDIFSYARHGKYNEVKFFLENGIDPDSKDDKGNTILIIGAQNGNKRIVKLALKFGGQINMFNNMGNTALHFTNEYKYNELSEYLIIKGANPEIKNFFKINAEKGIKNQ